VFWLVSSVFPIKDDQELHQIHEWRKKLSKKNSILQTNDSGSGSKVHSGKGREVNSILRKSSIKHKYGRILYSLVKELNPQTVIELGTGIGISTAYLAKANETTKIFSIDADPEKSRFALHELKKLGINNVIFKTMLFKDIFPLLLKQSDQPAMVFIDGDHSYKGTLEYFESIKKLARPGSFIVFDDIRWSTGMEQAWDEVKSDPSVAISIDLFFIGIVFFREGIFKQDFVINF
jgi:predicted O-methyltransferase YrrM